ncbi:hypothetical protein [Hydrogenophaga sp.]|uniref:hypothetical protein n=1 Tax=Hydrogenophaga sp. TaxID=1904254 RepID=UPI003D2A7FE1
MKNQTTQNELAETRLYTGRLMTPDDVVAALSDRDLDERTRIGRRWMFCCDVNPKMFEQLRGIRLDSLALRVTGFVSSLGGTYAVLTHQVAGHQHRLLLPLYDAEVQEAIIGAANEPHGFLVSNDNQTEAVVLFGNPQFGQELLGLPGLSRQLSREALAVLIPELPSVIMAMTEVARVPSLCEEAIMSVSVTVVMPIRSMLRVDEKLDAMLDEVLG